MRTAFLILATLNLLFLAWARWVDSPEVGLSQDGLTRLPRLQLVTEARPVPEEGGSARKMALRLPTRVCTSVGPFNDVAGAGRMTAALTDRGFTAVQRTEETQTVDGYWVYVSGMKTDADVAVVIDKLEKGGFMDARAMKETSDGRRVSVGLFGKRERAERRAWAVQHSIGLQAEIVERTFPGTVHWIDVDARVGVPELAAGLTTNDELLKVGMRECPGGRGLKEAEAAPRPSEAAGHGDPQDDSRPLRRTTIASAPKLP